MLTRIILMSFACYIVLGAVTNINYEKALGSVNHLKHVIKEVLDEAVITAHEDNEIVGDRIEAKFAESYKKMRPIINNLALNLRRRRLTACRGQCSFVKLQYHYNKLVKNIKDDISELSPSNKQAIEFGFELISRKTNASEVEVLKILNGTDTNLEKRCL